MRAGQRIEAVGSGHGLTGWRERVAGVLRRDPVASRDARAGERFERLLVRLVDWVRGRDEVDEAFLHVHADGLVFLVLAAPARYGESFEEELSALDVELACDGDLRFRVDVIALPRGADPREVLRAPLVSVRLCGGRCTLGP